MGIDLFIATSAQGRGLGPDAIRTLAAYLVDERGHHRLTIDPPPTTRAPFAPTGSSASGRWAGCANTSDANGRWVDGLLMDLLANELVR